MIVNRFIAMRLDEDVYQTITSFIPKIYADLGALDLADLLRSIKARLVTSDQLKFKRMHFELAKQTSTENPWKYENHLLSHYRSAQINDEGRFMDIYKKGVYNNELRKLLLLHDPPLTTMEGLKAAVHHYQVSLLRYARTTSNLRMSAMAGLGTLQREDLDQRKKTI